MPGNRYEKAVRVLKAAMRKEFVAVLLLLLGIVFLRSERKELQAIGPHVQQANAWWLTAGLAITALYIFLQAGMYKASFAAIGLRLPWPASTGLFLKRNFLSVFLPGGSMTSLAYSPSQLRKAGFTRTQVYQASGLFAFAGLLTVVLAGLPVVIASLIITPKAFSFYSIAGLLAMSLLITGLVLGIRSLTRKGWLYQWLGKHFPALLPAIEDIFSASVNRKHLTTAILLSLGVELCGMAHLFIVMTALGVPASLMAAASAYIVSVLLMVVSPFLRGLGAVEISLVYVLEGFGYSSVQSLSVMVLYRLFEFWLPLLAGLIAFAWKGRKLFSRTAPALMTLGLGIINIVSVALPPVHPRLHALRAYLPLDAIHASNLLVLLTGLALIVTSAFLLKGLRNAWLIAVALSLTSLAGHLTKALDYEESIIAALTLVLLLTTRAQYRAKSSNRWMRTGVQTALLSAGCVLAFGFISFYFIDKKHFGVDFTWWQSLQHTLRIFLLVEDETLHPLTRFAHEFMLLIRVIGFLTWGFFLFSLVVPFTQPSRPNESLQQRARFLLNRYGHSSLDYFKQYRDKLYFFSDQHDAFIAYRIAGSFAIVLEEPVCAEEWKAAVLYEFDRHCRKMGLKTAFYRVDEGSMSYFKPLRKQQLMIGQEGIVDVDQFSLEGRDRKSLRNGLNNLTKKGYTTTLHPAPQSTTFLTSLQEVSDNWLDHLGREEMVFAQGIFDPAELKQQDIVAVANSEGRLVAFLNIIPDYAADECTYDLIRKTADAPAATADALVIELITYARTHKKQFVNLGMAPLTGMAHPQNTAEQLLHLLIPVMKRFRQYDGLRDFKEKYATTWEDKYLVYGHDFDLLQLPSALKKIMRPSYT